MKLNTLLSTILTSFLFLSLLLATFSCELINPNSKIAGQYELRIDNPKNKNTKGFAGFIGKTLLKNALQSDVEFHLDGRADFDVDIMGITIGDVDGGMTYEVQNGNTLLLKSEDKDEVAFQMTKTDDGFELKNDDITFYLKKKEE